MDGATTSVFAVAHMSPCLDLFPVSSRIHALFSLSAFAPVAPAIITLRPEVLLQMDGIMELLIISSMHCMGS